MTENIEKIIQKQQALEYLKKQSCTSASQLQKLHQQATDAYSKYIISQCIRLERRNQRHRFFASVLTASLLAVLLFLFAGLLKTGIGHLPISRVPEQTVYPEEATEVSSADDFSVGDSGTEISDESSNNKNSTEFSDETASDDTAPYQDAANATASSETPSTERSTIKIYKNSNGEIETTLTLAQDAIDEGDFTKAQQILDNDNVKPDGPASVLTYFNLYVAEGNYDLAVNMQVDYLNNAFGTQNIRLQSFFYANLQDAKDFPLSDDTRQRCEACIKACEESITRFTELDNLIEDRKYEEALEKCDTMRNVNGCSDNVLFYSYRECYLKLEKYEEFAEYLITQAQNIQKDGDLNLINPDRFSVEDALEKIYDKVSPATQEKITALNFIDQDN